MSILWFFFRARKDGQTLYFLPCDDWRKCGTTAYLVDCFCWDKWVS